MILETAKLEIDELSREELIALIYEMAKEIGEMKAEIAQWSFSQSRLTFAITTNSVRTSKNNPTPCFSE